MVIVFSFILISTDNWLLLCIMALFLPISRVIWNNKSINPLNTDIQRQYHWANAFARNCGNFSELCTNTTILYYCILHPNSLAAMSNPRTACGLVEGFVRSSKLFIIVYVQYSDNLSLFWYLKFDIFDAVVLECLFIRYYALVDFHVFNDASVRNWFLVSYFYSCVPLQSTDF